MVLLNDFGFSFQGSNSTTSAATGPIFSIVPIIAIFAAVVAFAYRYNPQAALWRVIKKKLFRNRVRS